ncbi:hypothetical protein C8P69_101675 [Phreatobacter oligotrophus]|uniref:Uncharacterized protein n=1 Tax=Phreatobacter oligotrophus TaxID=1122261 RepID=A0A2T4ZJ50_9HYPH|nr:hypothetical protein C8P69_101675 [Phreatobacter oligotrophus]
MRFKPDWKFIIEYVVKILVEIFKWLIEQGVA